MSTTGFGDIFARGLSSIYGTTPSGDPTRAGMAIQTGGKIFDYYQTQKQLERDEELLRREQAAQRRIMAEQLDMARRRAGEESSIRQGIVSRTQQLEQALNQARAAMGQAPIATQDDINQNYQQIRDTMRNDYFDTLDRVSSQGFADAIAKGMDRSDRFRDEQRDLSRQSAQELRKIDQEAYNAAISRLASNIDTIQKGRTNRLKEIGDVYGGGIDYLKSVMPTNAGTLMQNVRKGQDALTKSASTNLADSQKVAGTYQQRLEENVSPNLGYMLGTNNTYNNPQTKTIEEQKQKISDLEKRIKALTSPGAT